GANGYVLKDGPVEEVVAGIRAAASGQSLISPRIATVLLQRLRDLATTGGGPVIVALWHPAPDGAEQSGYSRRRKLTPHRERRNAGRAVAGNARYLASLTATVCLGLTL